MAQVHTAGKGQCWGLNLCSRHIMPEAGSIDKLVHGKVLRTGKCCSHLRGSHHVPLGCLSTNCPQGPTLITLSRSLTGFPFRRAGGQESNKKRSEEKAQANWVLLGRIQATSMVHRTERRICQGFHSPLVLPPREQK